MQKRLLFRPVFICRSFIRAFERRVAEFASVLGVCIAPHILVRDVLVVLVFDWFGHFGDSISFFNAWVDIVNLHLRAFGWCHSDETLADVKWPSTRACYPALRYFYRYLSIAFAPRVRASDHEFARVPWRGLGIYVAYLGFSKACHVIEDFLQFVLLGFEGTICLNVRPLCLLVLEKFSVDFLKLCFFPRMVNLGIFEIRSLDD